MVSRYKKLSRHCPFCLVPCAIPNYFGLSFGTKRVHEWMFDRVWVWPRVMPNPDSTREFDFDKKKEIGGFVFLFVCLFVVSFCFSYFFLKIFPRLVGGGPKKKFNFFFIRSSLLLFLSHSHIYPSPFFLGQLFFFLLHSSPPLQTDSSQKKREGKKKKSHKLK